MPVLAGLTTFAGPSLKAFTSSDPWFARGAKGSRSRLDDSATVSTNLVVSIFGRGGDRSNGFLGAAGDGEGKGGSMGSMMGSDMSKSDAAICFSNVEFSETEGAPIRLSLDDATAPHHVVNPENSTRFCHRRILRVRNAEAAGLNQRGKGRGRVRYDSTVAN